MTLYNFVCFLYLLGAHSPLHSECILEWTTLRTLRWPLISSIDPEGVPTKLFETPVLANIIENSHYVVYLFPSNIFLDLLYISFYYKLIIAT